MAAPHVRTDAEQVTPDDIDPLRNPERRRRAAQASAIDIACGAQTDSYVLPAAADVIAPYIAAARRHGPLPPVRSEEWIDAPDEVKLASLLTLGVAYLVADPHRVVRNALKQVSDDLHNGERDFWRRASANHLPHDVLRSRREGAA